MKPAKGKILNLQLSFEKRAKNQTLWINITKIFESRSRHRALIRMEFYGFWGTNKISEVSLDFVNLELMEIQNTSIQNPLLTNPNKAHETHFSNFCNPIFLRRRKFKKSKTVLRCLVWSATLTCKINFPWEMTIHEGYILKNSKNVELLEKAP